MIAPKYIGTVSPNLASIPNGWANDSSRTCNCTHPSKYFVLCSFGMMSAKYAKIVLMLPPVIPSIMRPANSTHKAPPIPKTKYPIAEPNKHIKSNGRRPCLSLKAPSTGAAKTRKPHIRKLVV